MSLITAVLLGGVLFFDWQEQSEAAGWMFVAALVSTAIGAYMDLQRIAGGRNKK